MPALPGAQADHGGERSIVVTCFNYLNLSQVASAASGSPPSLWMKLAHLAYLTFAH
jgi:hypothetical protein